MREPCWQIERCEARVCEMHFHGNRWVQQEVACLAVHHLRTTVAGHKKARQGTSLLQGTVNGSRVKGRRRQVQAQRMSKREQQKKAGGYGGQEGQGDGQKSKQR